MYPSCAKHFTSIISFQSQKKPKIPVLQTRKLGLREVARLARVHQLEKWQSKNSNTGLPAYVGWQDTSYFINSQSRLKARQTGRQNCHFCSQPRLWDPCLAAYGAVHRLACFTCSHSFCPYKNSVRWFYYLPISQTKKQRKGGGNYFPHLHGS